MIITSVLRHSGHNTGVLMRGRFIQSRKLHSSKINKVMKGALLFPVEEWHCHGNLNMELLYEMARLGCDPTCRAMAVDSIPFPVQKQWVGVKLN